MDISSSERAILHKSQTDISWIKFALFSAVVSLFLACSASAVPQITFQQPTLADNEVTGADWIFINVTSSEDLNQSLLEWGNATGFTNVSMYNFLMTNWYVNMTDLADGIYNYTIFAKNATGNWNQTQRRWMTVDTTQPQIDFVYPTDSDNAILSRNWSYVNLSASDATNVTALIDFNRSLVGWWRFNMETGENDTFVRDWSTYGNNGTANNTNKGIDNGTSGGTTIGRFGKAFMFDGTNDYVNMGDPPSGALDFGTDDFSISAWFYMPSLPNAWKSISSKGDSGSVGYGVEISSSNQVTCSIQAVSGSNLHIGNTIPSIGSWHHAVCVFDRDKNFLVFLDSILTTNYTSVANNSNSINTNGIFTIGSHDSSTWYFNGSIDDVQLYNRALSWEEINASYNTGIYRLYHNFTNLADGTYTYTAYAQDLAGNVNQTETRTLTIETTITIQSPTNKTYGTNSIWFNITRNDISNWSSYSLDGAPNISMTKSSGNWNYLNDSMSTGHHIVRFYVNDSMGKVYFTEPIHFTVENITITESLMPLILNPGETITVSGQAIHQSDGNSVADNDMNIFLDGQKQALGNYRKAITINGSNVSLADHQINLTIDYASAMNPTFQDLRFTYYNSTTFTETQIPYWIELNYSGLNATIWIKTNLTLGNNTIYMYYGDPAASSQSDINASADYLNNFSITMTPTPAWTNSGWSLSSSRYSSAPQAAYSGSSNNINNNIYLNVTNQYGSKISFNYWVTSESCCDKFRFYVNGSERINTASAGWTTYSENYIGTNPQLIWQFTSDGSVNLENAYFDDVVVRKYITPEPTIHSVGSQQSVTQTDSAGGYNYTYTIPLMTLAGTHTIKVNITDSNNIYGENSTTFVVRIGISSQNATGISTGTNKVMPDQNITISAIVQNSTYGPIDSVWVNVTGPDNQSAIFYLNNASSKDQAGIWDKILNISAEFSNILGNYTIRFYANDTTGLTQIMPAPSYWFNIQTTKLTEYLDYDIVNPFQTISVQGEAISANSNIYVILGNDYGTSNTTQLNDTSSAKNITLNASQAKTEYLHLPKYIDILSATFDIKGYAYNNSYPTNPSIDIGNDGDDDFWGQGYYNTTTFTQNKFNGNLSYSNISSVIGNNSIMYYIKLPKAVTLINAKINISGARGPGFSDNSSVNKVTNGDFETGDFTGWSSYNMVIRTSSNGVVKNGTYSARFTSTLPTYSAIWQTISSINNQEKFFTMWYYPHNLTASSTNIPYVQDGMTASWDRRRCGIKTSGNYLYIFTKDEYTQAGVANPMNESRWYKIQLHCKPSVSLAEAWIDGVYLGSVNSSSYTESGSGIWIGDPWVGSLGYGNSTLDGIYINLGDLTSFPENITLNVGNDLDIEWNFIGVLNTSNSPNQVDLNKSELESYLSSCSASSDNKGNLYCTVPINVTLTTVGNIILNNTNISYYYNSSQLETIYADYKTAIISYLSSCIPDSDDYCDVPVNFSSDTQGTLEISNINITYVSNYLSKITTDADGDYSTYITAPKIPDKYNISIFLFKEGALEDSEVKNITVVANTTLNANPITRPIDVDNISFWADYQRMWDDEDANASFASVEISVWNSTGGLTVNNESMAYNSTASRWEYRYNLSDLGTHNYTIYANSWESINNEPFINQTYSASFDVKNIVVSVDINEIEINADDILISGGTVLLLNNATNSTPLSNILVKIDLNGNRSANITDTLGGYTYRISDFFDAGTYTLKVNVTDSDGMYGENITTFTKQSITIKEQAAISPQTYTSNANPGQEINISAKIYRNVDNPIDTVQVNITLPNATVKTYSLINTTGKNQTGQWYRLLNLSQEFDNLYGEYNVTFFVNSSLSNGSTITKKMPDQTSSVFYIRTMLVSSNLDRHRVRPSEIVSVYGKAQIDPDLTDVINNSIALWLNESIMTEPAYIQPLNGVWSHRKIIDIYNPGNALIGYQMHLTNISWNSDMKNNFEDLRFTYFDGIEYRETELPYWIESNYTQNNASFWIKTNLTVGTNRIYMYYGNQSATSESNNSIMSRGGFANTPFISPNSTWCPSTSDLYDTYWSDTGRDALDSFGYPAVNYSGTIYSIDMNNSGETTYNLGYFNVKTIIDFPNCNVWRMRIIPSTDYSGQLVDKISLSGNLGSDSSTNNWSYTKTLYGDSYKYNLTNDEANAEGNSSDPQIRYFIIAGNNSYQARTYANITSGADNLEYGIKNTELPITIYLVIGDIGKTSFENWLDLQASYIQSTYASKEPWVISVGPDVGTLNTDSSGNYNYTFQAPLTDGNYTLKVNLTDTNGIFGQNITYTPLIVDSPPNIEFALSTPQNNAYINDDSAYINVSASDIMSQNDLTTFVNWNNSLIGWWRFNRESDENDTIARDRSSWGNNGTLTNMNPGIDNCTGNCSGWTTSGKFGNGMRLDGVNDYVIVNGGASLNITHSITIELWVKTNVDTNGRVIQKHAVDYGQDYGWMLGRWADTDSFEFKISTTGSNWMGGLSTDNSFLIDTWYHVVGTYDNQYMRIYINGVENTAESFPYALTGNINPVYNPLLIGVEGTNSSYDEVRIWNRALSPEEINASYNTGLYRLYHNFTNLSDGTHTYTAYAEDIAGNVNQTGTRTLTIDTYAPLIQIILPQNTIYNTTSINLNYTAPDANLNTVWYNYNGTNTIVTGNISLTALDNQQSTLTLYANDTAGNINSSSVTFTTDTASPSVSLIEPLADYNTSSSIASFTFNVTDSLNASMECSLYINSTLTATNSTTANATETTFQNMPVSSTLNQNWTVSCSDGVNSNASEERTFNIDSIAPEDNSPPDASYEQGTEATIVWTLTDNYAPGYYRIYRNTSLLQNDTASWTNSTSLNVWINTTAIWTWNYTIIYNDSVGIGIQDDVIITITDSVLPAIIIDYPAENNTLQNDPPALNGTCTDANGISEIWTNITEYAVHETTSPFSFTNTSAMLDKRYDINIICNDTSDNQASAIVWFVYDSNAPVITLTNPAQQYNTTAGSIDFTFTATDSLNTSMECSLYINGTLTATNSTTANATETTFQNMAVSPSLNQNWTVSCTDGINTNAPGKRTFNIDNLIPTSNTPDDASYPRETPATINWTLYDNHAGGYYTIYRNNTLQNISAWTNNTDLNIWVNTSTIAIWNYTIVYNDSIGNIGTQDEVIITIISSDTTPPSMIILSPSNTTYSTEPELNFTYTEADPDKCWYSLNYGSNQTLASCSANSTTLTSVYGSNNFILYMNDTTGNMNSTQKYWTYDNLGPDYSDNITSEESPATYSPSLSTQFDITVTDQYSPIDTVLLEFNGTNYTTTNITSNYTKTLFGIASGTYNYRWHMNDTLGNTNTTSALTYTINKAATTLILLLNGNDADQTYYTPASVNATYISNNNEATTSIYRNGSLLTLSGATNISQYQSEASYNYTISTYDSQNYTSASASHIVTLIATLAPNITDWQNNITNNQSLTVTINETQSIFFNITASQPVNYAWSLDSVDQSQDMPNFTYTNTEPGIHSIKVNISNINDTDELTWTLMVKDIPDINSVQESIDPVSLGSIITIEANITDLDADLSGRFIVIDGTWYEMQPNGQDRYLANYTPQTEKHYSYFIFANDTTGLSTNTTMYTFTSQQNPTINDVSVTPSLGNESTNFVIQANITDFINISTAYARFTQPEVFEIALANISDIYNTTYNSTKPGLYIFYIWSNDTLGAISSSSNMNFTIQDTTHPDISAVSITPYQINETTVITITVNSTDYNLTSVYAMITGPSNSTRILSSIGKTQYSNTTGSIPHKPGFYTVEIKATDTSNNNAIIQTNYTVNDTEPPSLNSLIVIPTLANLNTNFTITANITDNDVVNSTMANITKPDSSSTTLVLSGLNPYSINFTETGMLGLYTLYIIANDTSGNILYSFIYPIGIANFSIADTQPPSINELNATPSSVNTTDTITINANVTDDNGINFVTAEVMRPDLYMIPISTFTNMSEIYTANYTETTIPGIYILTMNATDIAGNTSSATINFTAVDTMTPQITLFSIDDNTPSVTQEITFTATSYDNNIINKLNGTINITNPYNTSVIIPITETGSVNQGSPPTSVAIQSEANYTPTIVGNYTAILTMTDLANNTAQSTITFKSFDTTEPSISSISIAATETENITINITADEESNYTLAYDAGLGWNYASNSSQRLNHTITLPEYSASTTIHYYINLTDQYANSGRYPSIGVSNFTVDGTLQFNQTTLTLNLTEKQSKTIQIELRNPSSIPIDATINKTKSWTNTPSNQYLNPLKTAIINIMLTPDDISFGNWQTTETVTAHGSALATFSITMNIAHAIGDGECDAGEACGTADCPACPSTSSSGGGGSSSGSGGGGGLPPIKHECETNANCTATQFCKNYKCVDIKCTPCEYIKNHICTKYECCYDTDCSPGYGCKNNTCQKAEEPKSNITEDILKVEAQKAILIAKRTIIANKLARDTKKAEAILSEAEYTFAKENYGQAKDLAEQAKALAENASLLNEKETPKEETNRLFKSLIIILTIILVMIFIKKDLTRKQSEDMHQKTHKLKP